MDLSEVGVFGGEGGARKGRSGDLAFLKLCEKWLGLELRGEELG